VIATDAIRKFIMSQFIGAIIALAGGMVWGTGDFSGGLASQKARTLHVLLIASLSGLILLLVLAILWREPIPSLRSATFGLLAGIAGMIGLLSLYRGLSFGRASLVAPISSIVADAIPVAYSFFTQGAPKWTQWLGFALALVGIWFVAQSKPASSDAVPAHPSTTSLNRRSDQDENVEAKINQSETMQGEAKSKDALLKSSLRLALIAGLGFGFFFVLISQTESASAFGSLAVARTTMLVLCVVIVMFQRSGFDRPAIHILSIFSGCFDAMGNALFLIAKQFTSIDVAVVLSSLYPASNVLLARFILKEHISRQQWLGLLVCMVAIALIVA
jgi:drug/metabolite transporter (DMT)-like permease